MIQSVFAGAAGDVVLNPQTSTQNIIQAGGTDPALTLKALNGTGTALLIYNKSVDSFPSWQFGAAQIRFGGGSATTDTYIQRTAAGLLAVTGGLALSSMPGTVAPLSVTGAQPASSTGAGGVPGAITLNGGKGGNTTGTTGQAAATGAAINIVAGDGGNAPAGSTNGAGGGIILVTGAAGSGLGTAGSAGSMGIRSGSGSIGIEFGRTTANPGAQSPFIDWHYAPAGTWAAQDFNIRMQNNADRSLRLSFGGSSGYSNFYDGGLDLAPNLLSNTFPFGARALLSYDTADFDAVPFYVGFNSQITNRITTLSGNPGTTVILHGVDCHLQYGDVGVPAIGTTEAFSAWTNVVDCNDTGSEQGLYVGFLRYEESTRAAPHGRAWLTDLNLHTRIGRQMQGIPGASIYANKYDSAAPAGGNGSSSAMSIGCGQGGGGGGSSAHYASTTYPMQSAIHIYGRSGPLGASAASATAGWTRAIMIGNAGAASHLWSQLTKIDTGIWITDYTNRAIHIQQPHSSATAAFAIVADAGAGIIVANGGLSAPSKASAPVDGDYGANARNGLLVVDSTANERFWYRAAGRWHWIEGTAV